MSGEERIWVSYQGNVVDMRAVGNGFGLDNELNLEEFGNVEDGGEDENRNQIRGDSSPWICSLKLRFWNYEIHWYFAGSGRKRWKRTPATFFQKDPSKLKFASLDTFWSYEIL